MTMAQKDVAALAAPAEKTKRGPVTKAELKFIGQNHLNLSTAEIALHLGRTEDTIRQVMMEKLRLSPDDYITENRVEQLALQKELQNSPEWELLKQEFTPKEREYFKHRYGKLMAQFSKEEITATEETQLFLLIKYEILKHRNLADAKDCSEDIARLSRMIHKAYDDNPDATSMDDKTRAFLLNLENQLQAARAARQSKSTEYSKLTDNHSKLMKELKATRDQRITRIENSKQTFLDIIRNLQEESVRAREGRQMELVRLATEKERLRLSQQHEYVDKSIDQPFLTPETVE